MFVQFWYWALMKESIIGGLKMAVDYEEVLYKILIVMGFVSVTSACYLPSSLCQYLAISLVILMILSSAILLGQISIL